MRGGGRTKGALNNTPGNLICVTTGKVIYQSAKAANMAGIGFVRRKGQRDMGKLEAYPCSGCDGYHLGRLYGKANSGKGRGKAQWQTKHNKRDKQRRRRR